MTRIGRALLSGVWLLTSGMVVFTTACSGATSAESGTVPQLPSDEAGRAELRRQMDQIEAKATAEPGPSFLFPEDQRAGWIEAWNRFRDCTRAHGFDGVTPVAPTFGDGRTPGPVVSGSGPVADAALKACRFDTSLFDVQKIEAAVKAQSGPPSTTGPTLPQTTSDAPKP